MKFALTVLKVVTAAFAILYLGDYLSIRFQFPNHRQTLGTVQIDVYYAVRLKGAKTEYMRADPETETCTYSLLPQIGYRPCWYVARHKQKWIDVGKLRPTPLPRKRESPPRAYLAGLMLDDCLARSLVGNRRRSSLNAPLASATRPSSINDLPL
jgi:hypothetical protein